MKMRIRYMMFAVAIGGLIFAAGAACENGLFSAEVAGWVQAAGSILAIIAGFAAARDQARSAHDENVALAAKAEHNARRSAISLAALALDECDKTLARLHSIPPMDGAELQWCKRRIEYQRETIASFPLTSLNDESMMMQFAPLAGSLDSFSDNIREVADTTEGGRSPSVAVITKVVSRLSQRLFEARTNLECLRTLVGDDVKLRQDRAV